MREVQRLLRCAFASPGSGMVCLYLGKLINQFSYLNFGEKKMRSGAVLVNPGCLARFAGFVLCARSGEVTCGAEKSILCRSNRHDTSLAVV
jgi:hypothetical protein